MYVHVASWPESGLYYSTNDSIKRLHIKVHLWVLNVPQYGVGSPKYSVVDWRREESST